VASARGAEEARRTGSSGAGSAATCCLLPVAAHSHPGYPFWLKHHPHFPALLLPEFPPLSWPCILMETANGNDSAQLPSLCLGSVSRCALGFPQFDFIFATPASMQRVLGLPAL